jgi:asparagine N-glycosylation enzyme membrane subunit Stt3
MGETLPLRIGKSKNKTFLLSLVSIFLRYILLAVPLIVAVKFDQYNLISVVVGIFMIQLFILADHIAIYITSTRKKRA